MPASPVWSRPIVLGKRRGYGTDNLAPYDLSLAVIGTGLLWVGWFGFNGGSALGAGSRASMAIVATHLAACAGALTWMALEWWNARQAVGARHDLRRGRGPRHHHAGVRLRAAVARLVIGMLRRRVCFWACTRLKHWLGYDDSLDVFGVHGVGGILGTTAGRRVRGRGALGSTPDTPRDCRPARRQSAARC